MTLWRRLEGLEAHSPYEALHLGLQGLHAPWSSIDMLSHRRHRVPVSLNYAQPPQPFARVHCALSFEEQSIAIRDLREGPLLRVARMSSWGLRSVKVRCFEFDLLPRKVAIAGSLISICQLWAFIVTLWVPRSDLVAQNDSALD